jgi:hypothetical protein
MNPRTMTATAVLSVALSALLSQSCILTKAPDQKPAGAPGAGIALVAQSTHHDSASCFHCHAGYDGEQLSLDHERAGIGCRECHGACVAHNAGASVEDAPDIMYPLEDVNPSCLRCHSKMELLNEPSHREFFDGKSGQKYCTDCHGEEHRLAQRVIRWDRRTGKLLWHK